MYFFCSKNSSISPDKTHPSGWIDQASPEFHGLKAAGLDTVLSETPNCKSCHGVNDSGGTSGVSCYKCHNYPHLVSWNNPADTALFHGVIGLRDSILNCQVCHGTNYKGGRSANSCFTCHTTYPHSYATWVDSLSDTVQFHSAAVIKEGKKAECQACHGIDYTGGTSKRSCYYCHISSPYPHKPAWGDSASSHNFHGASVIAAGNPNECKSCHGTDYKGGNSRVSCFTCHVNFPHPAYWTKPDSLLYHGNIVENSGDAACRLCHGSDLSGGNTGVACADCH